MKLTAVLFDMDGVIVNTEPLHKKAYYQMFEKVGVEVESALFESFTGQTTHFVCKQLKEKFALNHTIEEMISLKREHFKTLFATDPDFDLMPGVLDLIHFYHTNGIKLVLASSASYFTINAVFDRFGLNPYFVAKISGTDLKASKPHPEIFEKAADLAFVNRENCMVIEDSTNGFLAAKAAGIFCLAYENKFSKNQDYSIADKVISDFKEAKFLEIS